MPQPQTPDDRAKDDKPDLLRRFLSASTPTKLLTSGIVFVVLSVIGVVADVSSLVGSFWTPDPPATATVSLDTVAKLHEDVQLAEFTKVLGEPVSRRDVGELVQSEWRSRDGIVQAFTDRQNQVVVYSVTATSPALTAPIPYLGEGLRLRDSAFARAPAPLVASANYPANGRWSYSEQHGGGYATRYRQVALGTGWILVHDDPAIQGSDIGGASQDLVEVGHCLSASPDGPSQYGLCAPATVERLRSELKVDTFAIGVDRGFERVDEAGGSVLPQPYER